MTHSRQEAQAFGSYTTNETNPTTTSRRKVLLLGAAGAATLLGGGVFIAKSMGGEARGGNEPTNGGDEPEVAMGAAPADETAESVQSSAPEQANTFELNTTVNPNIHANRRSPEYFRDLAEKSPEKLADAFAILTKDVETDGDFITALKDGFEEAANTGRHPDAIAFHLNDPNFIGDEQSWQTAKMNYLAKESDTYDDAIINGLFRVSESTETADIARGMLRASRSQFFDYVRAYGDTNNAFEMNVSNPDIDVRGTGRYSASMDIEFTDTIGSYNIPGHIRVSGVPEGDEFQIIINHQPEYRAPFNQFESIS